MTWWAEQLLLQVTYSLPLPLLSAAHGATEQPDLPQMFLLTMCYLLGVFNSKVLNQYTTCTLTLFVVSSTMSTDSPIVLVKV